MSDEQVSEDELGALVAELERVGLVEPHRQDDGRVAYRLTPEGERLGQMLHSAGAEVVLGSLLDQGIYRRPPRTRDPRGSSTQA